MKTILAAIAVVMMFIVTKSMAAITVVTFTGPGYVSQGLTYSYTPITTALSGNQKTLTMENDQFRLSICAPGWVINSVHTGIDYESGVDGALINIFNGRKTLGQTTSYYFEVKEFTRSGAFNENIDSLAIDGFFIDLDGQRTDFAARQNSDISLPIIPEPTIAFVAPLGLLTLLRRRRS